MILDTPKTTVCAWSVLASFLIDCGDMYTYSVIMDRMIKRALYIHKLFREMIVATLEFSTFFGLWNLDILRAFYPQMCISPHVTTLQVYFLEYALGLYFG